MMGYKPEVTNPQHTKVEIFKGKVKNKNLNSEIGVLFSNKLFLTVNKHKNHIFKNSLFFVLWYSFFAL
jgi:hypothetical protein